MDVSDTLVSGHIVIPITRQIKEDITLTGVTAARLGITSATTRILSCAPMYAITTHKIQGATRDAVILDLSNRKKSPDNSSFEHKIRRSSRTMATMLVACTRVKNSKDMQYVGDDVEHALADIKSLQHENFARLMTV